MLDIQTAGDSADATLVPSSIERIVHATASVCGLTIAGLLDGQYRAYQARYIAMALCRELHSVSAIVNFFGGEEPAVQHACWKTSEYTVHPVWAPKIRAIIALLDGETTITVRQSAPPNLKLIAIANPETPANVTPSAPPRHTAAWRATIKASIERNGLTNGGRVPAKLPPSSIAPIDRNRLIGGRA